MKRPAVLTDKRSETVLSLSATVDVQHDTAVHSKSGKRKRKAR
jgi:hypothetical protein